MNKKPADGERSAASGYRNQYLIGANIIFDALERGDLEWIGVADPEAGRVDDVQVGTTARVDAFQVKWEQYPGAITFNDLTHSKKSAPPLFKQLSDGWQRLKISYPHKRVVVHLVTNQYPSTKGQMPQIVSPPSQYHFAAFIEQAWKPAQANGRIELKGEWEPIWKEIQKIVDFSLDVFVEFVLDCSLDFQVSLPEAAEDIISLHNILFNTAASPERVIKLTRKELLSRLGWEKRYSFYNIHEIPEPKYLYRPIQSTVKDLKATLDDLKGGYIGVFGSPGSGKSTLLTQTLRTLPIRIIRYYAYVPDSQDSSAIRGESIIFLHDITLRLNLAGIRGNIPKDPSDRNGMIDLFHKQMNILGEDYQNTGEKTVILIDGLDHIAREQHPVRSLLNDLPLPQEIPTGVYFILGTQTDELSDLPPRVLQELMTDNRRVEMGKFTPLDTRSITLAIMPNLCEEEIQKIFELSDGHPLALIYLLKEIQQIPDTKKRLEFLNETKLFEGNIDDQYWSHWHKLEKDEDLRFALGLLCRTRGPIPMKWVATWTGSTVLRKIQKLFLTYFEEDNQDHWTFFHNSFRLFLIARTSEPLPGQTKEQQNQTLHMELAKRYKSATTPWSWEALYHYFLAGDHEAVISLATWEWFLQQANSLRPLDAIQTDIKLALKSAGKCKDIVLLARLTLIGAAIEQRIRVLEEYSIADLLLKCDKPGLAENYLRDGNKLRVKTEQALKLSAEFYDAGLKREAQRTFELSEPLELLSGKLIPGEANRPDNLQNDLQAWVNSAILFRPANEIVETIRRIRVSPRWNDSSDIETESQKLQDWLMFQGALACCERNDWDSWQVFYDSLENMKSQTMRMFTLLRSTEYVQKNNIAEQIQKFLPVLLSTYPPSYFKTLDSKKWSLEGRISFAELLSNFEEHKQESKKYIENIDSIPLYDPDLIHDEETLQQKLRFRLSCLRYFLGESQEPRQLLEKAEDYTRFPQYAEDEEKQVYRQIALATYETAKLWAWGKSGNCLSSTAFMQEIKWIIDLFGPRSNDLPIQAQMSISGNRYDVLNCLILAAKQHGRQVLIAMRNDFKTRWQDSEEGGKWPSGLQRKLINSFTRAGIDQAWVHEQLLRISPIMLDGLEPYSRAEECKAQAESWLLINNKEEALKELIHMVNASRGVMSEKDYQLSQWVNWLDHVNVIEQDKQKERIQLMLHRLASVKGVVSGVTSAAEELLKVIFSWNPNKSISLLKTMLEVNLISYEGGIIQILYAALDGSIPPIEEVEQIISNLIFPFVQESEPNLLEKLIITKAEREGNEKATETAQFLIKRIGIDVLSNKRFEWIQGILDSLEELGISPSQVNVNSKIIEKGDEQNSSQLDRKLYLKNGDAISSNEAQLAIKTISDLKHMLENEDDSKTTYFDWADVVEHLLTFLESQEDLEILQSLMSPKLSREFSKETSMSRLHIALSKGYDRFNNLDLAWKHAEQALNNSNPSGWVPYWDGGVRLKALNQLKSINPNKTSDLIFDLYASDLSERSYYPSSFILNLYEIFGLINNEFPLSEIWIEIENYLNDLFNSINLIKIPELEAALDKSDNSLQEKNLHLSMAEFLLIFITFPAFPIAQGSVRALSEILPKDIETFSSTFNIALSSSNDVLVEHSLMVLDAIYHNDNQLSYINIFQDKLIDLCSSSNFSIRLIASKLISYINSSPLIINSKGTNLPSVYQLQIPEISFHNTDEKIKGKQMPVLVSDPARILRPLDIELRFIASISNLAINNVLYRATNYFHNFSNNRIWLSDEKPLTEKKLIAFLNNIGVQTVHNKPHIFAARQALAYVIAELWDCGYLGMNNIDTFNKMLINYDPLLISTKPSERPENISPILSQANRNAYNIFSDNWTNKANDSIQLFTKTIDNDHIILGERTNLKFLQEDWPTETRYSVIKGNAIDGFWFEEDIDNGHPPFFRENNVMIKKYSNIQAPPEEFIVSNESYGFETPGANWIALNPILGYELGWELDSKGLFQWINASGNIVANSLWWHDGYIESFNRFSNTEVAEGWLVLVTKIGLHEIRQMYPNLNKGYVVSRRLGWLGEKGSDTAKQIIQFN